MDTRQERSGKGLTFSLDEGLLGPEGWVRHKEDRGDGVSTKGQWAQGSPLTWSSWPHAPPRPQAIRQDSLQRSDGAGFRLLQEAPGTLEH